MRVSGDEDVDVELSLHGGQAVGVAPGHDLMAVNQADFELTYLYNFGFRKRGIVVERATNDMDIRCQVT